ncbi:uncharacterized protein J4E92_002220 [Alternaria infectoria]|uniref:uncharacterized protein n=1 Tax=Alternaria infectoria TaxID=45303 RepID=UPI00222125DE|nr:uncharacterized protein J4E92_002220 [Alternaria infectoria]KAI4937489.1 hypothetical protein J4E92_002220 [Alternaria infectoria]
MAVLRACSPIATALVALLLLPRPVTAVPHNHGHKHVHRHVSSANDLITLGPESLARRDTSLNVGDLPRYSEEDLIKHASTCARGPEQLPLNPGVPRPVEITKIPELDLFPPPESVPGILTMHNYCGYDLYWFHFHDTEFEHGSLPAGGTEARPLAGKVMKVSKTTPMSHELQVEYAPKTNGELWYNLSLINCIAWQNGKLTTDTSGCAGHEAGLQLGQNGGLAFQCRSYTSFGVNAEYRETYINATSSHLLIVGSS